MKKLLSFMLSTAMIFGLFGCAKEEKVVEPEKEKEPEVVEVVTLTDGTYSATANGFSLEKPLTLELQVKNGKISAAQVTDSGETSAKLTKASEVMFKDMVEYQTANVDLVAGATSTSMAIRMAAIECVEAAGGKGSFVESVKVTKAADETLSADVVVVGLGGSGVAAALSAASNGAKVIAVEKAGMVGGTSVVTSGPMTINATSQVAANEGKDLVDGAALLEDWVNYTTVNGVQDAKPEIIEKLLTESGKTLEWLIENGFAFDMAKGFLGGKWTIFAPYTGNKELTQSYFDKAMSNYTAKGGQYYLNTEAKELIVENGAVKGVVCTRKDGSKLTVKANSVILACGGFGGNEALMKQYLGEAWKLYGSYQNDGAGISMAVAANANVRNIDMPPMSHFSAPVTIENSFDNAFDNDIIYGLVCSSETIALTKEGKRFVNEASIGTGAYVGGARFYRIYTSSMIKTLEEQGFSLDATGRYLTHQGVGGGVKADTPITHINAAIDSGVSVKNAYKASSLEELVKTLNANGANMNIDEVKASIAAYNTAANGGEDVMKKKAECFARLGGIDDGEEYYVAVVGAPYIYSTCGGLDINSDMQVLDTKGNPISGLYAVGTDSMGVLFTNKKGYANYGGVAQGWAFTSGRLAGEAAARK